MILAWIGLTSVGLVTARYFKPLWLSHSLFGVRIWFAVSFTIALKKLDFLSICVLFQVHRSCMIMALLFAFLGAVSIFLYTETFVFVRYSLICFWLSKVTISLLLQGTHQIFGAIALLTILVNPIGAVFRPECESSKRWIFNWIHWAVGSVGHVCSIVAIFLAYQLTTIRLPAAYLWSIAFYLFFHLTVHSLLQLYFCNCRHTKGKSSTVGHREYVILTLIFSRVQ